MYAGKRFRSGIIIILIFIIYFIVTIVNQQEILSLKKKELEELNSSIEQEEKLKSELEAEKIQMDSDEYIEKKAREELGLVKDGEVVFVDDNK